MSPIKGTRSVLVRSFSVIVGPVDFEVPSSGNPNSFLVGYQDVAGPHRGGCQNYGPLLDPYYNTASDI